ncbi:phage portal protein [uncultured Clostridium sp.]|uniref:phage portal protein n=1 Tax=uncultured Clostridium sp. TaxID=59620 RepID=UPI0028E42E97|nr:phage portal protein [uncultured Clostridium sp.]
MLFDEDTKNLYLDAISDYKQRKMVYDKIYDYCITGKNDAYRDYKHNPNRSNLKVRTNFIKKFIKEEVSYLLSNPITYTSKSDNDDLINLLEQQTAHWDKNHDKNALRNMLSYGSVFELYYTTQINNETCFNAKIVTPRDGYLLEDEYGDPIAFFRFFKKKFDKKQIQYIDIYTKDYIYHCDYSLNEASKDYMIGQPLEPTPNRFGEVPVVKGKISDYEEFDTLFNELKDLVDAYQTNLSDIVNEISDYRLAFLIFIGCQIDAVTKDEHGKTQLDYLKEKGAMSIKDKEAMVKFLTKDINDTFVQNTLNTLKKNMYEISNHIDTNEKMQSNLSGSAIRNRLIGLEQRVKDSEGSMKNLLMGRFYFLLKLFNKLDSTTYDYRDIEAKFTLNIPQDDLTTAQMLAQVPDGTISKQTARTLFGFISNPVKEGTLVNKEIKENKPKINLDDATGDDHGQS